MQSEEQFHLITDAVNSGVLWSVMIRKQDWEGRPPEEKVAATCVDAALAIMVACIAANPAGFLSKAQTHDDLLKQVDAQQP